MTIKTFWTILFKILGLWLIKDCISVITQFVSMIFSLAPDNRIVEIFLSVISMLAIIALYFFIIRLLIFKTDWLINKFQLLKDFEEGRIELNYDSKIIIRISIIIIGGLIFTDSLPIFCKSIFAFLQQKTIFVQDPASGWVIFYLIKTIIGYFMITNSKLITSYIDKQTKKTAEV